MNKIKTVLEVSLCAVGITALVVTASQAQSPGDNPVGEYTGGQVHFVGKLTDAACVVSQDIENQTVEMGTYRTGVVTGGQPVGSYVPFNIKLIDCDRSKAQTAALRFTFSQDPDEASPEAIAIGQGSDAAKGVVLKIFNGVEGDTVTNGTILSAKQILPPGQTLTFPFNAQYFGKSSNPVVQPGNANADVNFNVIYN